MLTYFATSAKWQKIQQLLIGPIEHHAIHRGHLFFAIGILYDGNNQARVGDTMCQNMLSTSTGRELK